MALRACGTDQGVRFAVYSEIHTLSAEQALGLLHR